MKYAILLLITCLLCACNLTPEVTGGKIPSTIEVDEIEIRVKEYNPHDLSLKLADRHIENSSFVVTNYSSLPDYEPAIIGGLGVAALDSEYELYLPKELENRLANYYSLSVVLFEQLNKLKVPSKNISLSKTGITKTKEITLILEPYALISVKDSVLIFHPQLIASLYDKNGKFVWQSFYGVKGKSIRAKDTWDDKELNAFFINAYNQISLELKTNIQGQNYDHDVVGLDDKLNIEIEINLPEEF